MTTPDIQQAKEWAKYATKMGTTRKDARAAIDLIQSLPEAVVDGDKLREVIAGWGNREVTSDAYTLYRKVLELIPAPRPRTLADMPLGELKDYVGGEVMVDGWANPTMLVSVIVDEGAVLARRLNKPWPFVEVRPLSDLTPVEAPEQEIESTPEPVQPRPEDVPPGESWLAKCAGFEGEWISTRSSNPDRNYPWTLTNPQTQEREVVRDSEVTLISRLAPVSKENA